MNRTKKELLEEIDLLRKKVELLESGEDSDAQALYGNIIRSAPVGIAVMNADMTVRLWNPYFEEYTDVKKEDVIGRNLFEVFPGLKAAGWDRIYADVLASGRPFIRHGYKYIRRSGPKKGEVLYQNSKILPLVRNGVITGVTAILEDVTAVRRAEERLWTLSYAIEQSPMPVIIMDSFWHIEYVNRSFVATMGYTLDEVAGRHISCIKSDVHPQEFYRNLQATAAEGVWLGDICASKKNGERHWMQISVSPIRNSEGEITNFVSLAMDDTGRRKAAEALGRSEARLRKAQALAHFGIWEWNLADGSCSGSDEADRILGYAPGEVTAFEAFIKAVHPEDRKTVKEAVDAALYRGTDYSVDFRVRLLDGSVRHCHAAGEVTRDNAGRPVRFFGTIHDMTDSQKLAQEILKAQKLESIGVMAGGVAHSFNNILMTILSNIYLAKTRTKPSEEAFRNLIEAEKAALRARGLTTQMLTFSRGGLPVKKPISIVKTVKDSADYAISLAGAGKAITFEYGMPESLPDIEADEGQIRQVINNLVANAAQAMPLGGKISISCEAVSASSSGNLPLAEGSYVRVTVADEGTGIPENLLQKIFDPFFTTRENVSGLGLSTAYSIVKNHGGCITAESKGTGAAFHVYLPAAESAPAAAPEGGLFFGKGRVLVMDDEEMIREAVGELLGHLGYEVAYAVDGCQAIETYRMAMEKGEPFKAVIMDLTIPNGMGGKEAVKGLLELDPGIKAIVSSGYSNDPVMSDYRKYGFSGCIAKPYRIEELSELVYRTING